MGSSNGFGLFWGWSPLIPTIERLDYQMKYYPDTDNLLLRSRNQSVGAGACFVYGSTYYALFANITGNDEYREFMNREFWATWEALYDKEERLFYRDTRYINQKRLMERKYSGGGQWMGCRSYSTSA